MSNQNGGFSLFWVIIMIIGIIISFTGIGAVLGVPMIGIAIARGANFAMRGDKTNGCGAVSAVILILIFLLFIAIAGGC